MLDRDRRRLFNEFREAFSNRKYRLNPQTQAVVVLSGQSFWDDQGNPIEQAGIENWVRVAFGVDIVKQLASRRSKKPSYNLTTEDIERSGPILVLNGETEQLPVLEEMTLDLGIPSSKILLLDCGRQGKANSLTQMLAINRELGQFDRLILLSSDYHVPRVKRTAEAQLHPSINFDVLAAPHYGAEKYDISNVVRGEINRIISYSNKGDIASVSRGDNARS